MSKYITAEQVNNAVALCKDEPFSKASIFAITELLPSADVVEEIEIIEWHEVKTRKPTDEEKHAFALDMMDVPYIFICDMPQDGENILIQTPWGVSSDVCEYDCDYGYGLEEYGDWDDVIAWAYPPKGLKSESLSNGGKQSE